jgi:hypothetical protein
VLKRILNSKIRSWNIPQLLLVTALLLTRNIIDVQYNNFIYNKGPLEQCDQEEKVEVNGAATISCLEGRF